MTIDRDYYLALEVAPGASREMIAESYERLAKRYQPDPDKPPADPEKMAAIDEAFDVLDDPSRRAEYDESRRKPSELAETAESEGAATGGGRIMLLALVLIGGGIIAIFAAIALVFVAATDDDGDGGSETVADVTTESGLMYTDLVVGEGAQPQMGDTVVVHYTGTLEDGTVFDSSVQRGVPFDFVLGIGEVIQGWDEGIATMNVGGKRVLIIPPELAYGDVANGPIPANSTLTFEVELLEIQ